MKRIIHIILTLIAATTIFSSCNSEYLTNVEPEKWQKNQFERQIKKSLRNAAQSPGLTDGSTIIIGMTGDTLIAPSDSALRAVPARTIYVEIQSPQYPGTISGKAVAIYTTAGIIGVILIVILISILGVFITVWRRQNGRNHIIAEAISHGYNLPESFFTGQPSQKQVNITTTLPSTEIGDSPLSSADHTTSHTNEPLKTELYNTFNSATDQTKVKQLRVTFMLIGIGIFIFLGLSANDEVGAGLIFGGIPMVIGVSRLLSNILVKRL